MAVAPDGALFVSDDSGGVIYRVTHDAASAAATASAAPAPIPNSVAPPPESDLAMALVEAASDAALEVSAPFAAGEPVPAKHSADGDNASPALAWTGAPDDAASFVVLMEDPDADAPVPFVHWIVYDLPADVTSLREGLPTDPILPDPEGVKQGANSMGATGYFGPKPPVGDPPHSYHFQVRARRAELGPGPRGGARGRARGDAGPCAGERRDGRRLRAAGGGGVTQLPGGSVRMARPGSRT